MEQHYIYYDNKNRREFNASAFFFYDNMNTVNTAKHAIHHRAILL